MRRLKEQRGDFNPYDTENLKQAADILQRLLTLTTNERGNNEA